MWFVDAWVGIVSEMFLERVVEPLEHTVEPVAEAGCIAIREDFVVETMLFFSSSLSLPRLQWI